MGSKKRSRVPNVPAEQPKNSIDWDEQTTKKKAKKEVDSDDEESTGKTILPVEVLTEQITNEDFRIVAGSYERILYGINAFWKADDGEKVMQKTAANASSSRFQYLHLYVSCPCDLNLCSFSQLTPDVYELYP